MPAIPPDTLLFITPGCPHCSTVMRALDELTKQVLIGKVTVVDATQHPEHADHRVRADACYLLGLTGSADARTYIEVCLDDAHAEVREIAAKAMKNAGAIT